MNAPKSRRTLEKGSKNQVRTVFEELSSCDIDDRLIRFLVRLALGSEISDDVLKVKNSGTLLAKQGTDRDLFDEITCNKLISLESIKLEHTYNHVEFTSYSNQEEGPYYFDEPNAYDWRVPPDPKVENLIRTILPTPSENIFEGIKKYTPVSIILTSGRPNTSLSRNKEIELGKFKCRSGWDHYIIKPSLPKINASTDLLENFAERVFILFKTLGLASHKMGRSVDKKIFKELLFKHSVLRQVIGVSENQDGTFNLTPSEKSKSDSSNFLNTGKYKKSKQSIKLKFNSLRIDKPDRNNSGASIIDIDTLSTGLSHLTTRTNATVITFYVESDYGKDGKLTELLVRPYIIAPDIIIDMFLDFREFGPRNQHSYASNIHRGIRLNKILKEEKFDLLKYKKKLDERNNFFFNHVASNSLVQSPPNSLSAKINKMPVAENNKITDFRTTLAFSYCWTNETKRFDNLGFDPNPDLKINSPTPYRFVIPV